MEASVGFNFRLMQLLGFDKFTINFLSVTLCHEIDIAGCRRPGLPIPATTRLIAPYVWYLLLAADRPGRDCQFQLAAGCLAQDYQFQLAAF